MIKNFRKLVFSLQGKFILVASLCLLVFSLTGNFLILSREKNLYTQDIINQGEVLSEISGLTLTNVMLYEELGMMDREDLIDYFDYFILNLMERDKRVKYIMVLDKNGGILAHSNSLKYDDSHILEDKSVLNVISELKREIVNSEFKDVPILKITAPLNISTKNWGVLQFGLSTETVQESLNSLHKELLIINIVFSTIALLLISLGAKVLAKPVVQLTQKMDSIKNYGDFNPQAHNLKERQDEIGKLQKSFLWMLRRLREADEEHKKTVEVLGRTEKMVSIGRLASGVAHEINNPLGGITLCFKNLVESKDLEKTKKEELIKAIDVGLQKIKKIVEQLVDLSRITVTEKTPVNVNTLINHILVLLNYPASKKHIKIINDFSDDLPEISMDENKMTQVFLNIMLNAMQAVNEKGIITIKTGKNGQFCEVSINDTGEGIPSEVMPNIFDPFYTTKSVGEGTGLGLSVSKGIVEQHGGTIEVDSKVGVGTTFRISLPIKT